MAVDPLLLLLRAARKRDPFGPVVPDWAVRLRQTHRPAPPSSIARHPTLDGAMRNEWGAPARHPVLPIFKRRAKRSRN